MKKDFYDRAEIEIIRISAKDVLAESITSDDPDELIFVPKN